MKYSFLINSIEGGGTEKVCKLLAVALACKGHSIDLFIFDNDKKKEALHENINLIFLGKKNSLKSFRVFIKILPSIQTSSILVFNHELALSLLFAKFFTRKNLKIISRMSNTFSMTIKFKRFTYRVVVNLLMKFFYRYMDHYIFQSEGIKADLIQNYGVTGPSTLLSNPIEIPDSKHYITPYKSHTRLLYVGRLVKQKNIIDLLNIIKDLHEKYPNIILTIVGDGPEREILEAYTIKNNLDKKVFFVGQQESVSEYYYKSDLTLLTSFNEGFPNVLLESIAHGVPVISYNCPSGPSEIIENGVNGFLVEYLNQTEFKEKIILGLNYNWESDRLINSINRFKSEYIVSNYEKALNQY